MTYHPPHLTCSCRRHQWPPLLEYDLLQMTSTPGPAISLTYLFVKVASKTYHPPHLTCSCRRHQWPRPPRVWPLPLERPLHQKLRKMLVTNLLQNLQYLDRNLFSVDFIFVWNFQLVKYVLWIFLSSFLSHLHLENTSTLNVRYIVTSYLEILESRLK